MKVPVKALGNEMKKIGRDLEEHVESSIDFNQG